MANAEEKLANQPEGKFYVDEACINCNLCREIAPDHFRLTDDEEFSIVFKQPENEQEEKLCMEAKEDCPVEAIGNDG